MDLEERNPVNGTSRLIVESPEEDSRTTNGESRLIMEGQEDMKDTCHLHTEDQEGQEDREDKEGACCHQTEEHHPAARGITKGEM